MTCSHWTKISDFCINLFAKFAGCQLYQEENFEVLSSKRRKTISASRGPLDKWLLVRTIAIAYLCVKIALVAVLQYAYDNLTMQYKQAKDCSVKVSLRSNTTRACLGYANRLASIEAQLKFIGAPYLHLTFISETANIFISSNTMAMIVGTLFYYKFIGPYNVGLFRVMHNEQREARNIRGLIRDECDQVNKSSHCYLIKVIEGFNQFLENKARLCSSISNISSSSSNNNNNNSSSSAAAAVQIALMNHSIREKQLIIKQIYSDHKQTGRILQHLLLKGSLVPETRRPYWLRLIKRIYVSICLGIFFAGSTTFVMFVTILPIFVIGYKIETNYSSIVCMIETNLLAAITVFLVGLTVAQLVVVFVDQAYLVHKIVGAIEGCIRSNTSCLNKLSKCQQDDFFKSDCHSENNRPYNHHQWQTCQGSLACSPGAFFGFAQEIVGSGGSGSTTFKDEDSNLFPLGFIASDHFTNIGDYETRAPADNKGAFMLSDAIVMNRRHRVAYLSELINRNLFEVLMHFRIFIRQFSPLKHYFSYFATLFTTISLFYPFHVLVLFQVTYVDWNTCLMVVGTLWIYLLWYNCAMLPLCVFHAQCQHLYRKLFELMAHMERLRQFGGPNGELVYKSHLVSLFRRELQDPELTLSRMSIIMLGGPFSYKYLVRWHLWTGILTLYTLSSYDSDNSELGRRGRGFFSLLT